MYVRRKLASGMLKVESFVGALASPQPHVAEHALLRPPPPPQTHTHTQQKQDFLNHERIPFFFVFIARANVIRINEIFKFVVPRY